MVTPYSTAGSFYSYYYNIYTFDMSRNDKRRIPDAIDSGWFQRIFGFNEVVGDYNTNQYRLQQMQLLEHNQTI